MTIPEGFDEGSQAIYCLGFVRFQVRPVGYGVIVWALTRVGLTKVGSYDGNFCLCGPAAAG